MSKSFGIPLYRRDIDDAIENDDDDDDTCSRHNIGPEMDDEITCGDLKWDHNRLKEEEVPLWQVSNSHLYERQLVQTNHPAAKPKASSTYRPAKRMNGLEIGR